MGSARNQLAQYSDVPYHISNDDGVGLGFQDFHQSGTLTLPLPYLKVSERWGLGCRETMDLNSNSGPGINYLTATAVRTPLKTVLAWIVKTVAQVWIGENIPTSRWVAREAMRRRKDESKCAQLQCKSHA